MGGVDRVRILVEMFKTASPDELFKEVGVYAKVGKNSKGFYKQIKHINGTQVGTPLLMMIMMMMMMMMMLMMMMVTMMMIVMVAMMVMMMMTMMMVMVTMITMRVVMMVMMMVMMMLQGPIKS